MYYAKDHLGTVRTTMNENGEIENATDYYPCGEEITGRSVNYGQLSKYKFTGKERDTETSYDYFGARYYDSRLGRWLQVDPMSEKYPGWSPYNYVKNSPINRIDPDGKEDWWALIKAAGKTVLSGAGVVASTLGMAGTSAATIGTAGASSPVTVGGFLWSFAGFSASTVSFAEGVGDAILALKTPDGMKAETLSAIKGAVEGFGGNATSQAIAQTIFDAIGFQGISNLGREGLMQALGVLNTGSQVSQDVIDVLNSMVKEEKQKQEEANKRQEEVKKKQEEEKKKQEENNQ